MNTEGGGVIFHCVIKRKPKIHLEKKVKVFGTYVKSDSQRGFPTHFGVFFREKIPRGLLSAAQNLLVRRENMLETEQLASMSDHDSLLRGQPSNRTDKLRTPSINQSIDQSINERMRYSIHSIKQSSAESIDESINKKWLHSINQTSDRTTALVNTSFGGQIPTTKCILWDFQFLGRHFFRAFLDGFIAGVELHDSGHVSQSQSDIKQLAYNVGIISHPGETFAKHPWFVRHFALKPRPQQNLM